MEFIMHDQEQYFSGKKLLGDDYKEHEILKWFKEEKEAWVDLINSEKKTSYDYEYHEINKICAFNHFEGMKKATETICGFGSAYGDEISPLKDKFKKVILIDSSEDFYKNVKVQNATCVSADPLGNIKLKPNSVSVFTCLGVLHHIPNVSHVLSEFSRCLESEGILILREPTTSLGDWRGFRRGLTKNERGIPKDILFDIVERSGFKIEKRASCFFPPVSILAKKLGVLPYNSKLFVYLDLFFSAIFSWNYSYHRTHFLKKFCPTSEFLICRKMV